MFNILCETTIVSIAYFIRIGGILRYRCRKHGLKYTNLCDCYNLEIRSYAENVHLQINADSEDISDESEEQDNDETDKDDYDNNEFECEEDDDENEEVKGFSIVTLDVW